MSATDAASTQLFELAELGMSVVRRIAVAVEAAPDTRPSSPWSTPTATSAAACASP
ncbi:MAG: hypothetical protein JNL41_09815, partial [Phenylobacterium sp.]|nr:hypothetical protein [Phenylobacterium sp.]